MYSKYDFQWLVTEHQEVFDEFSVAWVSEPDPVQALRLFDADIQRPASGLDDLLDRTVENFEAHSTDRLLLGAYPLNRRWSFIVEVNGYVTNDTETILRASQRAEIVSLYRNVNVGKTFKWAAGGEMKLDFYPSEPDDIRGSASEEARALIAASSQGSYLGDNPPDIDTTAAALALAANITGVNIDRENFIRPLTYVE